MRKIFNFKKETLILLGIWYVCIAMFNVVLYSFFEFDSSLSIILGVSFIILCGIPCFTAAIYWEEH